MKHTFRITFALIGFFLLTQFIGLAVINHYIDHQKTSETKSVEWKVLPYQLERPQVENQSTSFIPIVIAVIIGTVLVLLLIKWNKPVIWRAWFFLTILLTLSIALSAFTAQWTAFGIALLLTILRVFKPNVATQNISEVFIYGGLASVFVPIINIFAAFMLLLIISVYDIIAVWKTKHMVKLAEFQTNSRVFSGLMIHYKKEGAKKEAPTASQKTQKAKGANVAVLGGGDMGFPLIFAGVVMKGLMLEETVTAGFLKTSIIPVTTAIALFILLMKGQQNKYYPAMPFLSIGAVIGYFIIQLL